MNIIKSVPAAILTLVVSLATLSCGDQKKAAENRADQMNEDAREAMEVTEDLDNEATREMADDKSSQEMVMQEQDSMSKVNGMQADADKMVGGAMMSSKMNIIENASKANNLTTLVAAVKAAGLVQTLQGDGLFTVFAPTDDAFNKFPEETINTYLQPDKKNELQTILKYHVVPGRMNASDIVAAINQGNGKAELRTVSGSTLTAIMNGDQLTLKDEAGNTAIITTADVNQSNGVVHVINTVLLPKM